MNKTFAVIVIVALLLGACAPKSTPTPNMIPVTGPLPEAIGMISAENTLVESGPSDNLVPVTQIQNFFNNDTVRVTNGGIAKLDFFVNQISIRLFNDTAIDDVKADPSGTPDRFVRMKLVFGGLSGEVTKNGIPVHFELTNGVNIYILGTQFLVLFDPETSTTYIGNFDGTVAYSIPGQLVQFTQAGQLYEISSNFEIKQSTLNFTRTDIENLTSSSGSSLLATLKDYLVPTATPIPTATPTLPPTITSTPTRARPCDKAAFVTDVTVPDGSSFSPGFQFAKIWRLQNVGTCTWTSSYSLVFYRGEQMGGPASVNIPSTVAPGQTMDIAVGLVAPALAGSYRGDWMLRSSSGVLFGAGANGTTPIWVKVNVISTGTIKGTTYTDSNTNGQLEQGEGPQNGALVILYADSTHQIELARKTTNADGIYMFSDLNAGTYYLTVNGCGQQKNAMVNLNAGDTKIQDFLVYYGCACPYVYTEDPVTGEWEFQTTILYKLVDHESAQQRYLAQFNGKLLIREEESEISYLNRLYVIAKMSDGSIRILEPDVEELKHEDNGYIILHQGEEILISFHDYPITGKVSQWWVMAVGYYSPLR